jgi:hypothetical protein
MTAPVDPAALECARRELEDPTTDAAHRFCVGPCPVLDREDRPAPSRAAPVGTDGALVWFVGRHYPLNLVVEVAREGDSWHTVFAQPDAHARVALRIVSAALPPDAITAAVGLAPSRQAAAGRALDGRPVPRDEHLWLRDVLPDSPAPVEDKLEALLALVEPHRAALAALAGRAVPAVTVAYHADAESMQGIALAPAALARLGAAGLALELDLYAETLGTPPTAAD